MRNDLMQCESLGKRFAHQVKTPRRKPGGAWRLDEMFVTLRGEPYVLWRAIDKHGAELDILLQERRNQAAFAARFALSQAIRSPVRWMGRIRRTRAKSVDRVLIVVARALAPLHSRQLDHALSN